MVIDDFNFMRAIRLPLEADAPLVVDADGVLTSPVSVESFEPVSRRNAELKQLRDRIELGQLSQSRALNIRRKGTDLLQLEQAGSFVAGEGTDHALVIK